MKNIRHYENLHIPLWLLKDTCWMMEWKLPGILMVLPTFSVALIIAINAFREKQDEAWVQLAICFWISANSYWMLCEFSGNADLKNHAGWPFLAGLLCV